ncbi:hypothetical protein [Rubidibacter lacunae]|uniref:hypothetical protein n=1 Tax=Rubidibacter lacunae TaxID=582514 RepID=UPI0018DC75D0|nr:hypothetical protein [Rubidibacter lacunae]
MQTAFGHIQRAYNEVFWMSWVVPRAYSRREQRSPSAQRFTRALGQSKGGSAPFLLNSKTLRRYYL